MSIQSINPASGEVLAIFEEISPGEVERILAGAESAFRAWRRLPREQGHEGERLTSDVLTTSPGCPYYRLKAIMYQLLRRYRWSVPEGYTMPVQQSPISKSKDGLPIRLTPAD